MAQIMLDRPCVLSVVGEFVAGGVAQHVRVYRELDTGPLSGPPDDLPHRVGGERRVLDLPATQKTLEIGLNGPEPQPAAPPLHG